MRLRSTSRAAFCAALALLPMTGCSGGATQTPVLQSPQTNALLPDALVTQSLSGRSPITTGTEQLFVSDANGSIYVYGPGNVQPKVLSSKYIVRPAGLAIDDTGTLYIADRSSNDVLAFEKPYIGKAPSLVINQASLSPQDVAYDFSTGNLAVINFRTTAGGPGNVRMYAKHSTTPCATVNSAGWQNPTYGAFDAAGNLYLDGYDTNLQPIVGIVRGGCGATTIDTLKTTNTIAIPLGVAVLKNGNILIVGTTRSGRKPRLFTYAPAIKGSLGSPISVQPLRDAVEVETIAISADDSHLWAADDVQNRILDYIYPSIIKLGSVPSKGANAYGIAVSPAQAP